MRKTHGLINAGLLTAIVGLVSILNIFAFRASRLFTVSAVRGVAYYDCNFNGLKEVGESGFPNMAVLLTGRSSLGDSVTLSTATDAAGLYTLPGIEAGAYRIKFSFLVGSSNLHFSPQNIGGDEGADSDPDALGFTDSLFIDGITDMAALDAGVVDSICPIIYYTHPTISSLLDGDTLTVSCDNIPVMDASWSRGVNNSGGADLPMVYNRILLKNGRCETDGFVQFYVSTWTTQNTCGHQTQVRLYLKTIDTVAPTLVVPNDTTINLLLGDVVPAVPTSITTNDNCSGSGLPVYYKSSETIDACGKIITRIWETEDNCGNIALDTQRITVVLNPICSGAPATDTVVLAPFKMTGLTYDTCLASFLGSDRVLKNTWNAANNDLSATVLSDSCLRITRSSGFSGRDTITGWHCDGANANCRFLLLIINVLPDDPSCHLVETDTVSQLLVTCGNNGYYCLTGLNNIDSLNYTYSVSDNGAPYSGMLNSCVKDTTFSYEYYTLPFMGGSGKYRLDFWQFNSTNVTIASFDSLPQLVDTMNVYDPTGNWAINPTTYTIVGGTTQNTYGQIKVTKLSNAAVGTSNVTVLVANSGIKMSFTGGLHNVVFTQTQTGCADTLKVNVYCDTLHYPTAVNDVASTDKNTDVTIGVLANDTIKGVLTGPLSIINIPNHGTASVDGSNNIHYAPDIDFCGDVDTISYKICNADGCDTAIMVITVNCPAVGLKPDATDDAVSTAKNTFAAVNVLSNDIVNGALNPLLLIVGNPSNGGATVDGFNNIIYTPSVDFCGGNDTISYSICNDAGCDTAKLVVTVNCPAVIADPIAVDDNVTTSKNTNVFITPLVNDTINGTLLALGTTIAPLHGAIGFVGTDSLVYTPLVDYCGNDTIQYRVCRDDFKCDTATIYITVTCPEPVMNPIAVNDSVTTDKNMVVIIAVLANDTTNGVLSAPLSIINNPSHGTVSVDGSNNIVYTPATDFCGGNDTLRYSICTANGCDTGWVFVTVTCPAVLSADAVNDRATTSKNTLVVIDVLVNDNSNGVLTRTPNVIRAPSHGTAVVNFSNKIVYNPTADFCGGTDTLSYEICNASGCDTAIVVIDVTCPAVLLLPIAYDDVATTEKNMSITVNALSNDTLNGVLIAPLSIVNNPKHGTVAVDGSNNIVYTPSLDFCGGNDTLGYSICTANGCDTSWVFVTVTCPVVLNYPVAVDDIFSTTKNTAKKFNPTVNDRLNGQLFALAIVSSPKHGNIGFLSLDSLIYLPSIGFCGKDTIQYRVCNSELLCDTANIEINVTCDDSVSMTTTPVAVDDAVSTVKNTAIDIAVLSNDTVNGVLSRPIVIITPPKQGTAVINGSQITYSPQSNFCGGSDTLTYEMCNRNGCDIGRVIIYVTCEGGNNDANKPVAVDDNVTTSRNTPFILRPTLNDTINGTLASLNIVSTASHGSVTFASIDSLVYSPQFGYCGNDMISYSVCNQLLVCDTAKVIVTITCDSVPVGNDLKPNALDDIAIASKNTALNIAVLANDTLNGTLISPVAIIHQPTHGTATISVNEIIYTPSTDYCGGNDTLSYRICNATGCDTAYVYIAVNCPMVVTKPDAVNDFASTSMNTLVVVEVLANDFPNGTLTRTPNIISAPHNGTAVVSFTNKIGYTPAAVFCGGNDTLSYEMCNANGCDTALVIIEVKCIGERPDAVDDAITANKNIGTVINVLTNDAVNGTLSGTIQIVMPPKNGGIVVDIVNNIVYIPTNGFCGGNDTLTYAICNAMGCDTAQLVITVACDSILSRPIAIDDYASTPRNKALIVEILTNDVLNGVVDTIVIIQNPKQGTATINGLKVNYQPNSIFCGANDTLSYAVCSSAGCDTAKVIISVTCDTTGTQRPDAQDDAISTTQGRSVKVVALDNDILNGTTLDSKQIISLPRHGSARFDADANIIYTPDENFCGAKDTLTYSICTSFGCDTATVVITVTCDSTFNLLPVAQSDTAKTVRGVIVVIPVLQNDTLNGADTFRIVTGGKRGTAIFNAGNNIQYKPDSTFCNGKDTLVYEICNLKGCSRAQVVITVACDSLGQWIPKAFSDTASTIVNETVIVNIINNDTLRGATKPVIVDNPEKGIVTITSDNKALYIPNIDAWGRDTFTYAICNAFGCDTTFVGIYINPGDSLTIISGFSPNDDGINDRFAIKGIENYPNNEVYIYDRWGVEVFKVKGYNNDNGWDGSWSRNRLPDGTYFIVIIYNDELKQRKTGFIQIHR